MVIPCISRNLFHLPPFAVFACPVPGGFGPSLPRPCPPHSPRPCWLICPSMDVMLVFVGIVVVELLILVLILLLNVVDCCHCCQLGHSRFPTDKILRVLFLIGREFVELLYAGVTYS